MGVVCFCGWCISVLLGGKFGGVLTPLSLQRRLGVGLDLRGVVERCAEGDEVEQVLDQRRAGCGEGEEAVDEGEYQGHLEIVLLLRQSLQ